MQQAYGESARAFYQRMIPIILQIQEKHAGQLKEEQLANTAKEAFYNGLTEEFKLLIAHKVDQPGVKVSNLLQEVRKIKENEARRHPRYPPSVSAKNINSNSPNYKGNTDGYQNNQSNGYKSNNYRDKKQDTNGVRMFAPADEGEEEETGESSPNLTESDQSIWKDGYYYCLLEQADEENKRTDSCYNCRDNGHQ